MDNVNNQETVNDSSIHVLCGYAGGISPSTIDQVCESLVTAAEGKRVWIDMESGLRTMQKQGDAMVDVFDIHKCFLCAQVGVKYGLPVSKISLMSV